jgi:hypothetical protein
MPTFFLNGTTLLNSTAVFLDSEQLICAPDGYYSDGVIVREQLGCRLILTLGCPSCAGDCPVGPLDNVGTGTTLRLSYTLPINVGFTTGAVIVKFNPIADADGIIAEYNGSYYNELSSPIHGYLAAPPNLPTYIGITCVCAPCTYVLQKRTWDGTSFVTAPGTETIFVTGSQLQLTSPAPGNCVMVIPKTLASPTTVNVVVYKPCTSSAFDIEISCAEPLPTFQASNKFDSPSDPAYCGSGATTNTFYVAKVSNDNPVPFVDINDWVFQDENGENKLEDGYYLTFNIVGAYDTIQVVNGVVVATTLECP